MTDFTYRTDEWEVGGDMLLADVEITLNWSWVAGEPRGFVVLNCQRFDAAGVSSRKGALVGRNTAPRWIIEAMDAWVADNQTALLAIYRARGLDDEQNAEDAAWKRQRRSCAPSRSTHL